MIKCGLTGSIGTGKSTVSKILKEKEIKIIDADVISRDVLQKYPEIMQRVKKEFGEGYFDWRGEFKRKEFANQIFRFPKIRIKYEEIIMPYIKKEIENEFKKYEKAKEKLVILDAPTLIENNVHEEMDYVILVWADNNNMMKRVRSRDQLSNNNIVSRINAQMPMEEKKKYASIIINNNGDLKSTEEQVEDMVKFFIIISEED